MRTNLLRLLLIVALPLAAIGMKYLLDVAIAPSPWIIVTFVAVLLGAWIGGSVVGMIVAAVLIGAVLLGIPDVSAEPAALRQAGPGLELVSALLATLLGIVIRLTRARERQSLRTVARVSRATADLDRRWRVLHESVTEFAAVGSALQVEDLLIRRARQLTGATSAEVLPAPPPPREPVIGPTRRRAVTPDSPTHGAGSVFLPVPGEAGLQAILRLGDGSGAVAADATDGRAVGALPAIEAGASPGTAGEGRGLAVGGGLARPADANSDPGDGDAVESTFDEDDLAGALALAGMAGAALDRIRLQGDSGTARRRASRSGERLERLQELTTSLAAAVTAEAVGAAIVDHALDGLSARVGLFYVVEPSGDLRLAHARGYPIGLAGHDARLSRETHLPAVDAARRTEIVVVESPEAWRSTYPGASDRLGMTGTRSVLAVPIGRPPSGVLVVQRPGDGGPSDDDLALLEALGHQATQALERSRLYAHEREARQLQEAFIGVMSHEVRTPVTTILAGSKLLRRDRGLGPMSRELAADIEAEADRLFRLVEDLMVLSRLERGNLAVADEPVHLLRILHRVVASEASRWPATTFEVPSNETVPLVRGDETYVEQILRNLLTNAAKYSPAGSTVRIEVEPTAEQVAVRVLDQGPGVTSAEVEHLFSLFYRSPAPAASAAGAGIGLFVCRRLVDAMRGRVWARPIPEGGSEFGFALAIYPDDELEPDDEGEIAGVDAEPSERQGAGLRVSPPL